MQPSLAIAAFFAAGYSSGALADHLIITSITDAQASALAAPLSSYIAGVEASPSFAQVVAELAKATAHPDSSLGSASPDAGSFPAFAAELNAVAAQDQSILAGVPVDAQAFLVHAANGEIAVINSILGAAHSNKAETSSTSIDKTTSATVDASSNNVEKYSTVTLAPVSARPTGFSGANMSSPNASTVVAPKPTQAAEPGQHVASSAASVSAASFGMLAFGAALWIGLS